MSSTPRPYDHVRSEGSPIAAGTYRVVGVADDRVTLLRVSDSRGARVREGTVVYVAHDEYRRLETGDNPDEPSLLGSLALTLVCGGAVAAEILLDALTTVAGSVGVDPLADLLVVAGSLGFAVGVRRLWLLRLF